MNPLNLLMIQLYNLNQNFLKCLKKNLLHEI